MLNGIIDAALNGQGKYASFAYFFNGNQYTKYNWSTDSVETGYPAALSAWNFPGDFNNGIDAVADGATDKTYFFKGNRYIRYDWNKDAVDEGYPMSLSSWNFPDEFKNGIDAAINGKGSSEGKIYFFKDAQYIRYDLNNGKTDDGYPLSLTEWKLTDDFTNGINAAINGKAAYEGKLYFFKGDLYVRYDWATDLLDGPPTPISNWGINFPDSSGNAGISVDYQMGKDYYTSQAFGNAGIGKDDWQPSEGFLHNKPIIQKIYQYYTDTYNKIPLKFLWAGLGKMAGGVVLSSMDNLESISGDTETPVPELITIGKNIFLDLAWLHEAFLEDPAKAIALAKKHDVYLTSQGKMPAQSYERALTLMNADDADSIAEGNKMLLQNEQHDIIEPIYQNLVSLDNMLINRTRAFVGSVHPYHRDFILDVPTGDVLVFADRWKWIAEVSQNMWDQWVKLPQEERTRLINLPMSDIMQRNFGKTLPGIYIGADDGE